MKVCNPKGGRTAAPAFLPMLLMIMMLLINAYCCSAAVVAKSNTSFRCSGSRLDECLIEEDLELELGFLINPYVSRILSNGPSSGPNTGNPDEQAIKTCGQPRDIDYDSCIQKLEDPKNKKQCVKQSDYQRCNR